MNYHNPVLLEESVKALEIKPSGVYVDVTYGGGGHSREILKQLDEKGTLIAFDQDLDAASNLKNDERVKFIDQNFRFLENYISFFGFTKVDGIIADLGVSSHQFDVAERGFSFRFDAPLDMRMDRRSEKTASDILQTYNEEDLAAVFYYYAELRNSRKIASLICDFRKQQPIKTTADINIALKQVMPKHKEYKFLAKVFQALRIELNEEVEALKEMLQASSRVLSSEGRLVVLTYHSIEDRIVKNFMKSGNFDGKLEKDFYGNVIRPFEPITKKPIVANEIEINQNNRARSAKLRVSKFNGG